MSNAIKILPHYTYADYIGWEGKWEVIEGVPYAMSPAPTPRHQIISSNLIAEFRLQLKECRKCQVSQPVDYLVADDIILQPDILILCQPVTKKFLDFAPALVAEVLSASTALKDRHSKYAIYESCGIPFYIIIDPDPEEAEIYSLEAGQYKLIQKGKNIIQEFLLDDCSVKIDFSEIWK
jgi:Uma2 family endonuclease